NAIQPAQRVNNAVTMMRQVARAKIDDGMIQPARGPDDIAKAKVLKGLFDRVTSLETDTKLLLADLAELALAAGIAGDVKALDETAKRVETLIAKGKFDLDEEEKSYCRLSEAYRACDKAGDYKDKVFTYADQALAIKCDGPSKNPWQRNAAQTA